MAEYIELIKQLRERSVFLFPHHGESRSYDADLMHEAADAVEELSNSLNDAHNEGYDIGYWAGRRDYEPKWIPVTERLPIRGDRVLCFGDNGINTVDFVCGDKWCALPWFYLDGEEETGVTHWMPLPEPPKEDKNED